jgi:hypothetical protein
MFEGYAPERQVTSVRSVLTNSPPAFQDLGELQHHDTELREVIKYLQRVEVILNYSLSEGVFRCQTRAGSGWKILVPAAVVPMVFNYFHVKPTGGYLGILKTIQKIRQTSYGKVWIGIFVRGLSTVKNAQPASLHRLTSLVSWSLN